MIFVVEDDHGVRELELYALHQSGYEAEGFETPAAFRQALEKTVPDCVLLDVMLPGEDGLSLLRFFSFITGRTRFWGSVSYYMAQLRICHYTPNFNIRQGNRQHFRKRYRKVREITRHMAKKFKNCPDGYTRSVIFSTKVA